MTVEDDIINVGRLSAVPTMLRVISEQTGLRLALIARVTDTRWTACAVHDRMGFGLQVGQDLVLETTLCHEARLARAPVVIADVKNDPVYCDHHTPKMYGLQSYISVPILLDDGQYFGNLCALDSEPRAIKDDKTLGMFTSFAQLIGLQLAAEDQHAETKAALLDARATAELREQFIALLGHDVRWPLSAIIYSAEALKLSGNDKGRELAGRIVAGAERVNKLMGDALDFARGRLGGGIPVKRTPVDVVTLVSSIADEVRIAHPSRDITVVANARIAWNVDADRVQQVVANILNNAMQHGDSNSPVRITVQPEGGALELTVTNRAKSIDPTTLERMFQPYYKTGGAGLGLGLYIVAEIMKAHGGSVSVKPPSDNEISIVCRFPA